MQKVTDHFKLIFRGLKVLHELSPYNMLAKITRSFCDAVTPFVSLYMSASIINALIEKKSITIVFSLVLITVGVNACLTLISQTMDTVNYVKWNQFYLRYNMSIGQKAMTLDYSVIEDPETHRMIKNIDDAMKISNYGLIKLHSRIPLFFQHLFSLIFSLAFTFSVIFQDGVTTSGRIMQFMNSILADIILLLAIAAVSVTCIKGNTKISLASYSLLGALSKINRIYDYYLNQYLDGHKAGKDIRLYEQDSLIIDEVKGFSIKSGNIVKKLNEVVFRNQIWIALITFFLTFYTYTYVGIKAMAGAFAVGSIIKYSGAILQFSDAVSGMMDAASQLWANHPYLEKYFAYVDIPSETVCGQGEKSVDIKNADGAFVIEFCHVSFQYPHSTEYVLNDLNFTIKAGDKIAVVGKNGSGKTTMIKLLCRLYRPTSGTIYFNGVDIWEYSYQEYISLLGVVFQDFCLFGFALGQNVAADEKYDPVGVVECLKNAGFGERFRKMKQGTETILYKDFSEEGVEISGGEAQKIALARALYKQAPMIVLDEPTAALDPIAEAEIYAKFNEIVDDRTAVYISHRLSSCRFCEHILVFDEGRVVQQGTHDNLVSDKDGIYYELWHAQAQYYIK